MKILYKAYLRLEAFATSLISSQSFGANNFIPMLQQYSYAFLFSCTQGLVKNMKFYNEYFT